MSKCGSRGMGRTMPGVEFVQDIEFNGDLFNVGAFPALVIGEGRVKGELFRIQEEDYERTMQRFDGIEGYGGRKEGDLYTRTLMNIPEVGLAWVYTWNGTVEGMDKIEDGDWYNYVH